ncbi:hypothetical protein G6F19_014071 [Rhizopus arrhizus]|nr:hypothetical protein G6F19_014071 [Rhizopus arrhizus]KAG1080406.1 hypothetical protein G6F40_015892 [Rhizopus arrhizus]
MAYIQSAIDDNQSIPAGSFCTVPESVVELPMEKGAKSFKRQYPIAHRQMPELEEQINECPLLMVPKKDENNEITSHRVCLDVRGINKLIPDVVYPVPKIRSIFDNLAGGEPLKINTNSPSNLRIEHIPSKDVVSV